MHNLTDITLQQLATQRDTCDQAARERSELDVVSVLYAVEAKLMAGRTEEAREIVKAYRAELVQA